jgi:hypothetical protein
MVQGCEHARFPFEARKPIGFGGERHRQNLDRDVAVEPGVARAIDLAHAAGAQERDDFVHSNPRAGSQAHRVGASIRQSRRPAARRGRYTVGLVKIVLAGGSGFLGRALSEHLVGRQHEVVILTRRGRARHRRACGELAAGWIREPGRVGEEIDGAQTIVNLTGAGMADKRWTRRRKDELRQSRVQPARSLVAAIRAASIRPATFVQGSAVGFYGAYGDEIIDESFPPGQDFLGQLCVSWEAEAHPAAALGCRLVILRTAWCSDAAAAC